ncbi:MAG: lysophospholipid acyltransferase family protein [Nannocystaceae bacterium]
MLRSHRLRALLPEPERLRLDAYTEAGESSASAVFRGDAEGIAAAYAVGYWLHEHYFRVRSTGHEHLRLGGAAVLVANHSGVLPFDAVMLCTDVFRYTDPPRLVHYMVDYFAFRIPFIGTFFRALGQVPGTRRNFDGMVGDGHFVGVFPEGAKALGKPARERYTLYPFTRGHAELAARHAVPVIPAGIVGAEEQQTMVADFRPLARALRLPYFPITTTFPVLGPLGLLPKPVRYYVQYGTPIEVDPLAATNMETRVREVERIRQAVRNQVQRGLAWRRDERGSR